MPRNNDPGEIKTGPGKQVPGESPLTLTGIPGPSLPAIGEVEGHLPPAGGGGGDAGLAAHIASGHAHPAPAIYTEEGPETLFSGNVEGQLDELAGNLPGEPPRVGYEHTYLDFTGIPDWGVLKMSDSSLENRVSWDLPEETSPVSVFPYWLWGVLPGFMSFKEPGFPVNGEDPRTDPTFNSDLDPAVYTGTGPGDSYSGGFARPWGGPDPAPAVLTHHILERDAGAIPRQVVLSGAVYPADRGVLALLHWPADPSDVGDFLAQPLLDRCIAALLLGQGIIGLGDCADGGCDGGSGVLFDSGRDANEGYDPFAYPGQATGQYDLLEINQGVSSLDSSPLRPPFDDLLGQGGGARRLVNTEVPGPGQVRLGTMIGADKGASPSLVQPYGIPVLGATINAYDLGTPPSSPLGHTVLTSWNFYRYRLPVLDNYSQGTGLKWTPSGIPLWGTTTTSKEKYRYFDPAVPYSLDLGATELPQGGDYTDFPEDNYAWQLARYRHVFNLESINPVGDSDDLGTYILVHFKREADFEAYVRDGVLPDDVSDGYEVFSAYLLSSTGIEDTANRMNEETDPNALSPNGPALEYGWVARPYHVLRASIYEDPDDHRVYSYQITSSSEFSVTPGAADVMWVSGVAYFVPVNTGTGLSTFSIEVEASIFNFWRNSFCADDIPLVNAAAAPAQLNTVVPASIGLSVFAYGKQGTSYTTVLGASGAGYSPNNGWYNRLDHLNIPYTHLGSNGSGFYSPTNAPLRTNSLTILGRTNSWPISMDGDRDYPAFSRNAMTRLYLRKPLNHRTVLTAVQPYVATIGHGKTFAETTGNTLLYHSTTTYTNNGLYGNFISGAPPSPAFAVLKGSGKGNHEKFLDEVYRYHSFPAAIDTLYGAGAQAAVTGPGMGAWIPSPIETPVSIGHTSSPTFIPASWVQNDHHKNPLVNHLQVGGLPDRNPPLTDAVTAPFPSAGILMYPQRNYLSWHRPEQVVDGLSAPQPDYTSVSGLHSYFRCFDAAFNGSVAAEGQPFLMFRIDGLQLQDFAYNAPGPGDLNGSSGITLMIKVPGMTTWMDLGRRDGDGPSKQDPLLDGAGCLVLCPETLDGRDYDTGSVFSQVKVNVGSAVNLFKTVGIDSVESGRVPVLCGVVMNSSAVDFNFEEPYDPVSKSFSGSAEPGAPCDTVRGIVGIRLVKLSEPFDNEGRI